MDLEQQLRSVLTDERLDVHLGAGAVQAVHDGVRRRKRRNAALAAAASFVLVAGGIATGVLAAQGGSDRLSSGPDQPGVSKTPQPGDVKPPVQAPAEVAWAALPYDPAKPFALRGTSPQPGVPSCKAGQLSLTALQFQGATGSAVGGLTVTNDGATCGLQGQPVLTGYGKNDSVVATSTPDDGFIVHPWFALRTGQQARTDVQIFGDGSRCLGPVRRLTVDLGRGAGEMSADITWVDGHGVVPRCGSTDKSSQLDHYIAAAGAWTRRDGTPRLPMSDFSASITQQPTTVMQGGIVRYQVLLSTQGKLVDPCLPYREQLASLDGTQSVYGTSFFLVDCNAMSAGADDQTLDMELALPGDIPVGSYALQWQTPIQSLSASEGQTIQVIAAPPRCTGDQLSMTAAPHGGAGGSFYDRVIITNTSDSGCSLRGNPGVQFEASTGEKLPTTRRIDPRRRYETVVLPAHGGAASFLLIGADFPSGASTCRAIKGVLVIPPGGYIGDQALVPGVGMDCTNGRIAVTPVVAGRHASP